MRYHSKSPIVSIVMVFCFSVLLKPAEARAQNMGGLCGDKCVACEGAPDPTMVEGSGSGDAYLYYCVSGGNCSFCNDQVSSVTSDQLERLGRELRAARSTALEMLVAQHRERIVVHPSRSMVAVLGGCNGKSIERVVYLSRGQIAKVVALGVRTLSDHLRDPSLQAPRSYSVAVNPR